MRALLLLAALATGQAAFCSGVPNPNAVNNSYPIYTGNPKLARLVPNGKAYRMGQPGFDFWVTHLYGTPYEMGFAQGQLYPQEITTMINGIYSYIQSQIAGSLTGLPAWLQQLIETYGLEAAFDLIQMLTAPSTPQHFLDEIQGMADATGLSAKKILHIHLMGELTEGDCSLFGAWGAATAGGKTLAMRALDWDTDIPAVNQPSVTIYHPSSNSTSGGVGGHPFANVGFLGWVGALTGQSSAKLSIHEIGVSFPDNTFGKESFSGIPFVFLLRDILQFDNSWQQAVQRIQTANRTCDLILGVSDGAAGTARGIQYSASVAAVMDDTNLRPANNSWHPKINDVVYWGMDWDCPSYNAALAAGIRRNYGQLTPAVTIQNILPIVQTGDVHAAVYDLTGDQLYVSFIRPMNTSYPQYPRMAYDRQFSQLDLPSLFAEQL